MAANSADGPVPSGIVLHAASRVLELRYEDGTAYRLPFEFLRVYSPSAEVRGHAPGQETLQTGKRDVRIVAIAPIGQYAIQPTFSDGHDTGIYTWTYLRNLAMNHDALWAEHLRALAAAGVDRDAPMAAAAGHGHGQGQGCHH